MRSHGFLPSAEGHPSVNDRVAWLAGKPAREARIESIVVLEDLEMDEVIWEEGERRARRDGII